MPSTIRTILNATARAMTITALAGLTAGLGACVGYNSYDAPNSEMVIDGKAPRHGFTNPNDDPFPPIMTEAVRWVITRYPSVDRAEWAPPLGVPPEGAQFAVNLPIGVTRLVYTRVVDRIGYGAVPLRQGNEDLPTYHISRIWVNGDEAKVDIVRTVTGLPADASGSRPTQAITVRLRGGLQPWHVTSHRVWALNALPVPPMNYLPEHGEPTATPTPPAQPAAAAESGYSAVGGAGAGELINLPD